MVRWLRLFSKKKSNDSPLSNCSLNSKLSRLKWFLMVQAWIFWAPTTTIFGNTTIYKEKRVWSKLRKLSNITFANSNWILELIGYLKCSFRSKCKIICKLVFGILITDDRLRVDSHEVLGWPWGRVFCTGPVLSCLLFN